MSPKDYWEQYRKLFEQAGVKFREGNNDPVEFYFEAHDKKENEVIDIEFEVLESKPLQE